MNPTGKPPRRRYVGLGIILGILCALGFIVMGAMGAYFRTATVVCKPGYLPSLAMSGMICVQGYRP